jgi:hypothetical protein
MLSTAAAPGERSDAQWSAISRDMVSGQFRAAINTETPDGHREHAEGDPICGGQAAHAPASADSPELAKIIQRILEPLRRRRIGLRAA